MINIESEAPMQVDTLMKCVVEKIKRADSRVFSLVYFQTQKME